MGRIKLATGPAATISARRQTALAAKLSGGGGSSGLGASSDGKSLGLTAPRPAGQRAALERCYRQAGVSPREVSLVEAHGTGTVVGDRTELGVLEALYREAGAPPGACSLGSVKSQIGHTKCAAGIAGVVKVALALTLPSAEEARLMG